jgi:murein DD-endopeptidase MepM/ murein hydrolase activator NlpD
VSGRRLPLAIRTKRARTATTLALCAALVAGALSVGVAEREAAPRPGAGPRPTPPPSGAPATPSAPQIYVEAPSRLAAGAPFDVFVSSSVPVRLSVRYADEHLEAVEQDLRVSFVARPGRFALEVEAVDAEGGRAESTSVIDALLPPAPVVDAPAQITVGDPLTVRVAWTPKPPAGSDGGVAAHARIADAWVEFEGRPLEARTFDGGLLALVAVPLGDAPGPRSIRAVVVDEFGTWHRAEARVEVQGSPHPIQLLVIPASVLAVSTDDGRRLEAETLAAAFAAVPPEQRWQRPFMLPIVGRGTSGFGLPRRYGPGGNVSFHLGIDIAAPEGTPIHATNDGVVLVAGQYPIKGGLVVLDHGFGVTSLYFHQSRIAVEVGEVVERGHVIGSVGTTGLSTGPHLHWEMRVDGVPSDPMAWVDRHYPIPLASAP